jgi:hypothetical protein
MIVLPSQFEAFFGELDMDRPFYKAVFHLAVYGPAISAFAVIALVHGAVGVKAELAPVCPGKPGRLTVGCPGDPTRWCVCKEARVSARNPGWAVRVEEAKLPSSAACE